MVSKELTKKECERLIFIVGVSLEQLTYSDIEEMENRAKYALTKRLVDYIIKHMDELPVEFDKGIIDNRYEYSLRLNLISTRGCMGYKKFKSL